jgi:DNA repair protein RecO (recombination protein O)
MPVAKTQAVVIGRRGLGESDRLVTLYARDLGKIRGVARGARRPRSRFGSALEPFTLGALVCFDTGRSELLRIDHFDILHPFARVREDLVRFGHASWMIECLSRLTADHDPHPALYGLLVQALRATERMDAPGRVAVCFGARCIALLGHRPRLDACVACGRAYPFARACLDLDSGGLVCARCEGQALAGVAVSTAAIAALHRIHAERWSEAVTRPLGRLETELAGLLDAHVSRLCGQPTRTSRFLREVQRVSLAPATGGRGARNRPDAVRAQSERPGERRSAASDEARSHV